MAESLARLLAIMARLRDPRNGCEWDREQTFATIAPYTIEEAYEVADAIERGDHDGLRDELGDLLLQVVFHARMAQEAGLFGFDDVAASIAAKLERRHPHIFGPHIFGPHIFGPHIFGEDTGSDDTQTDRWEKLKAAERAQGGATSVLDGIALALPALMRAEKLQKRAARVGFDWPDVAGAAAKVGEELDELAAASTENERVMEAGDLLFAAVNVIRHMGVAPEDALRTANAKFERRFRAMEQAATHAGDDFAGLGPGAQDQLWQAVKRSEREEAP